MSKKPEHCPECGAQDLYFEDEDWNCRRCGWGGSVFTDLPKKPETCPECGSTNLYLEDGVWTGCAIGMSVEGVANAQTGCNPLGLCFAHGFSSLAGPQCYFDG